MTEVKLDLNGREAVWLERLAKDLAERDGFTWTRERVLMAGRGGLRSRLTFERSATDIMQLPSVRALLALAREAEGLREDLQAAREAVHPLLRHEDDAVWRRAEIVVNLATPPSRTQSGEDA